MPLFAAWLLASIVLEPVSMDVLVGGRKVGESTFSVSPDGKYTARTSFSMSGLAISNTTVGSLKAGKLGPYESTGKSGSTVYILDYKPGSLRVRSGKVDKAGPYTATVDYAGNLHPQLTAALLDRVGKGLKAGTEKKLDVYFVDVGAELPTSVRLLGTRTVRIDGKDETVRRFAFVVGPTETEYVLDARGRAVAEEVPSQHLRFLVPGWEGLFEEKATTFPELSAPNFSTEGLKGLKMRTRDGVTLVADLLKPVGRGPFPAILERTPYGRENALALADFWAKRGYVYVAQDCRGRGDSGGAWDPFVNEGKDGYDAVEWVAKQPWCDGKVGMIGGSYDGVDQWQAAVERPPSLRCIVPQVSPADAMRNLPYEYGTFLLAGSLVWTHLVEAKRLDPVALAKKPLKPLAFDTLPLKDIDKAAYGRANPIFQSWLRRPTSKEWKGYDHLDRLPESNVPALHVSGWFDGDGIGTKLNWDVMRRADRKDQWLVYGPWVHNFNTSTRFGDSDYGTGARFDLDSLTLRFFDTYLKSKDVKMADEPRVRAFVTGANRWVSLDGWPASNSTMETMYLAPEALVPSPGTMGKAAYVYDPAKDRADFVKLSGNRVALPIKGTYALFKGAPVVKPTAVAGPFEVRLFFKSSAVDTDLFATLVDLSPDGTMRMIGQPGKMRASYRDSLSTPSLLKPGQNYTALLRPWDGAHELAKGHRLGLLVDSSLFPLFARNLGTGEPIATGKRSVPQRNVILTGTVTPSRITYRRLW